MTSSSPPLCRDCARELTTMASQSAGLCPSCDAKRRDRSRADSLARDAVADLIDPALAEVLHLRADPRQNDAWGQTTFQAAICVTPSGLRSHVFVGVEEPGKQYALGDSTYEKHDDALSANDFVLGRLQEWAQRHAPTKAVIAEGYGMDSTDMTWRPQSLVRENGVVHVEPRDADADMVTGSINLQIRTNDQPVGSLDAWIQTPDGWKRLDPSAMITELQETIEKHERSLDYIQIKLTRVLERTGWAPGSINLLDLTDAISACKHKKDS